MSTYRQLLEKKAELELRIEEARRDEIREVVEDIRRRMQEYGLSAADLEERREQRKKNRSRPVPKYRDPLSGATWSGRGRRPRWFNDGDAERLAIR